MRLSFLNYMSTKESEENRAMTVRYIPKDEVPFQKLSDKVSRCHVSGEEMTMAHFRVKKGGQVPEHHHPNEQITYIVQGAVRISFANEEHTLRTGDMLIIPANVPHKVEALEDTSAVDVFSPPREDWAKGKDAYYLK